MADNLNAKSPKPTEKTKITNAVNRTTSETMRLGEPEKSVNHPTSLCTTTTKERKKTPAFQITSVTVGPRISNDGGDDSADDLDESHTDDISDVIDNSRITDVENETPSYSEDTFSKEEVFFNASNASLGTAPVIPTSSQYGLAIVGPEGNNNSQNPTVPCANNITNSIEVNTTSVSDPGNGTINIVNSVKPSEADMRDVHTHTARNERFKVVKIESTEPFKRGRWMCMDYLDHSVVQQQSQQAIIVKGVEQSDAHTGSVQYVGPDSGVVLMDGLGVDHPSEHQNMPSGSELLQQPPQMAQAVPNLSASQNVPSGYSSSVSPGQTLQQMPMGLVQQPVAIGTEMPPHAQSMSQVPIVGMVQQQPPTMGQSLPPQQMQTLLQGYQQSNYYPTTQHLASQASSMPVQNQSLVTSTAQQMSMQGSIAMSAPQPHLITQPQFQTQHPSPQFQATHLQQPPPQLSQPSTGMQGGPQPVQMNQPIQVSQSLPNQQIQVQVSQPMQPQSIQVQVSQPMQAQTQPVQTSQSMQVPSQPVPVQSSQSIQIPSQMHMQNQSQTVQVPLHMQPQSQPVQMQQQMQNVQVTQMQGQSQPMPISQMQAQSQPIQSQSSQIQGQTQPMSSQSQTMQGQSHSMNPQSQQMQAQQMQAQSLQQQMQVQSQPVQISQQLHQQSQPVQMSQMQPQSQPVQVSQQVQAQSQPVQVQAQMQNQSQSVSQHVQHMQQVQVSQMQSQSQNMQVPQMQNQSQSVPVQHQMQAQSQPIQVPTQIQPQSQTVQMASQIQQHSQPVSVSQHMPVQSLPVSQTMQSQPMGIPVQQVPPQPMQQLHVVGVPQPMMTPTSMSGIPTTPLPPGYVSAPSGVSGGVVEMAMHPEPVQEPSVGMQQEKVVGGEAVQPGPAGDDNPAPAVSEEPESASGTSAVAIDNKIEQAMDLVKSHLMFAVREEVEVLKERIAELMERINQLELENTILKAHASQETLAQLGSSKGAVSAPGAAPPPAQQAPAQQAPQGQAQQGAQVAAPPAAGGPAPNMV